MKVLSLILLFPLLVSAAEPDFEIPDWVFGPQYRGLTVSQKTEVKRRANQSARDFKKDLYARLLVANAEANDLSLDQFVSRGCELLRRAGDVDSAYIIQWNYDHDYRGYLKRMVLGRQITDNAHKPLIQFIDDAYNQMLAVVGLAAMKAAHISDIYVLNRTLSVAFNPCAFDMTGITDSSDRKTEYRNCVNRDRTYYGDLPIATFWIATVACESAAASAPGLGFLCGFVSSGAEYVMATFLGPHISDFIFQSACG